jgi:DNA segregation ATPase FtsK/SpoIIIE-like protein
MKKLYLGKDKNGKNIKIDFDKEKIDFVLLAGQTGSGKTIFHNNLYKELTDKYSPHEIGFVFLDMTRLDFCNWSADYLIKPVVNNPRKAINVLHELAELKTNKRIFIHIEECDMVYTDRESVEKAFKKLKKQNNVYIIYSTSRLDRDYLSKWMKRFIKLRVIFTVPHENDSTFLLGNTIANNFNKKGTRILVFNDQQILCQPFSEKEAKLLENFKL